MLEEIYQPDLNFLGAIFHNGVNQPEVSKIYQRAVQGYPEDPISQHFQEVEKEVSFHPKLLISYDSEITK